MFHYERRSKKKADRASTSQHIVESPPTNVEEPIDIEESSEEEEEVDGVEEFPDVIFIDPLHRKNFCALMTERMTDTRCVQRSLLRALGIDEIMEGLFAKMGLPGLFSLHELSYRQLTLEFLCSFSYSSRGGTVSFRMLNETYQLTLDELAQHLGLRPPVESDILQESHPYRSAAQFYQLFSGVTNATVSNMAIGKVQHVVIKLVLKILGAFLSGRPDHSKLTSLEVNMMASCLNPFQELPFRFNAPAAVARMFQRLATKPSVISCGAIITRLARSLTDFTGEAPYIPFNRVIPLLDEEYFTTTLMILIKQGGGRFLWWVRDDRWLPLPNPHLPPLVELPHNTATRRPPAQTYLIPDHLLVDSRAPPRQTLPSRSHGTPTAIPAPPPASTYAPEYGLHFDHELARGMRIHEGVNTALVQRLHWEQMTSPPNPPYTGAAPTFWRGQGVDSGVFALYGTTPAEHAAYGQPGALGRSYYSPAASSSSQGRGSSSQGRGGHRRRIVRAPIIEDSDEE